MAGDRAAASATAPDPAALKRAREATAREDYDTAVEAYRQALGGEPAEGPYALEYLQTLGATEQGWTAALAGMRRLHRARPDDAEVGLALAKHLTYRATTRREGIERLAALQSDPVVGTSARQAWRQALIWLEARPSDAPSYQRYIETVGRDGAVIEKLEVLRSSRDAQADEAYGARIRELFGRVDAGDLAGAESGFAALLKSNPRNADALGGLGVVRLRQQRYNEARQLLEQAAKQSPGTAGRWREARTAATFWSRAEVAETARQAGDYAAAQSEYAAAFAAPPPEVPDDVRMAYVDVLLRQGQDAQAEPIVRRVLQNDRQNPNALAALLTILERAERYDDAISIAPHLPPELQPQINRIRAEQLRRQAVVARNDGRLGDAERILDEALLQHPENPWVRLDLAEVYRAQGKSEEAATLLDGLAATHGDRAEVRLAQAYLDAERKDWAAVLNRLQSFTEAERSPDAIALQRRAWVQYQLARARLAMRRDQPGEAYRIVTDTQAAATGDPELLAAMAGGWADLQDPARAVSSMRRAMAAEGTQEQPAARIQYAALLLAAGQDAEFEVVARDLAERGVLDANDQAALDQLVVGYRVKLADRERVKGDTGAAYVQLRDALARYPEDPRVQMGLARLLTDSGDTDAAVSIYRGVLDRDAQNQDARFGLIDALLAGNRLAEARQEVDAGVQSDPEEARWWRVAGRLAEQEGRRGAALQAYRRAEGIEQTETVTDEPPQLAWIDERQPDRSLPAPVAEALAMTSPDALGPLTPRAAGVSLLPPPQTASTPATGAAVGGMRLSPALGAERNASVWRAPPLSEPVWLQPDPGLSAPAPAADGGARVAQAPTDPRSRIERLESVTSGWVGGQIAMRSRDGESGLSRLFNIETPVTWSSRDTDYGQLSVTLTSVYLDAGVASGDRRLRVGSNALIGGGEDALTDDAGGVAVGVGYRLGRFEADIGVTPLGFEEDRLVGGLSWGVSPGNLRLGVSLSSRAVTESLLSYAGAEDPLLGRTWGGISRSGGRVDVAYDAGTFGVYGYGGYYSYDGRNVESNYQGLAGTGLFRRYQVSANQLINYGVNLTVFGFEDNRRYFTFGHGGYFSPQTFTAITVPIRWEGVSNRLSWNVGAAFGIQTFREDGAAFYPGFDGLQEQLELLAESLADPEPGEPEVQLVTGYASQRNTGVAYSFNALTEYRVAPRITVGGLMSVDNARDFREVQALAYLRYYFTDQPRRAFEPDPVKPFYQY
ncbi:cellulose synthase subunit BcsC-related outer membrane protein [Panacagrimonas sp.]|uniref:cellulose synthase subunit BcsC-related outer membrane protein n=1 Tax=Panacagrimonas sp. TaxID=2480088 RepID=UPI003B51BF87